MNQGHWRAYKKVRGLLTVIHFDYLLHQTRIWRIFKALELSEEPKAFKLSSIFEDHRRQMAPSSKNIVSSSGIVGATIPMDGAPPQEAPFSDKEWLSPLLNMKKARLSLDFFLKFQTSVEVEQLTRGSQVRVWFVWLSCWWAERRFDNLHFLSMSMRLSCLWIRREPGELRVLRFSNAGLIHYEIRVWVSRLR